MSDTGGEGGRRRNWRQRWRRGWREPVGWRRQAPLLVGLVLLWMLLWDDLSWGNLVNGALLALLVTKVFYLPPAELSGRLNVYWVLVFLWHFALDLVLSSLQVARLALRPGYEPQNAVIAVDLRTSSDLLMTLTGHALTLVPGTLIVDVDRLNTVLYVHVLDVPDEKAVAHNRDMVLRIEERLIRAIGSREECGRIGAKEHAARRAEAEEL